MNQGIREFMRTCSNTDMKLASCASFKVVRCRSRVKNSATILLLLWFAMRCFAVSPLSAQNSGNPAPGRPVEDYSGMYAFLQEGEFVQITVDDRGAVTGLVSRYGDAKGDKREFLEQFFKEGKLAGSRLSFTTKTVHDVWYDFQGEVERGDAQSAGEEGYYVLKGKLTQYNTGANKKTTSKSQTVALKSFPKDVDSAPVK